MIFHRAILISVAPIDDSPYSLFDSITLYTPEELAAMDEDERDPGDIENDEIEHDDTSESDNSDSNQSDESDSSTTLVPPVASPDGQQDAQDETEHDAPIGHPEGYVPPEDSPAPIYNPDAEDDSTGGA